MKLIIDIPEEQYNTIKSDLYNTFPAEMKIWGLGAIRNGTPIPDNATNFDVYFTLFDAANEKLGVINRFIEDDSDYLKYNRLSKTWGNAPYNPHINNKPNVCDTNPFNDERFGG